MIYSALYTYYPTFQYLIITIYVYFRVETVWYDENISITNSSNIRGRILKESSPGNDPY